MGEPLSVKICQQIRDDIVSRKINEGVILTENELATKYGVSKAPIRDALHLLCGQGYLVSYPRKGYLLKVYSRSEIQKIQQVRTHIEKLSVMLAIKNASDEDILSLRKFLTAQGPETDPSKTNNTLFHMRLAEISGNEYVPAVLRELIHKVCRVWIDSEFDLATHTAIVDALLERNAEKALAALEYDLDH